MDELAQTIVRFCKRLEAAGIPYLIGGSVASGIWGESRQTNDVDVEIWITADTVASFMAAFDETYIVSEEELISGLESAEEFASVQVLDMDVVLKFDCFLQKSRGIDNEALEHSVWVPLNGTSVRVACPEHILVQKLRWYELGNRVSERQWRDISGIIGVTRNLRWELIERWANAYGVAHLISELKQG